MKKRLFSMLIAVCMVFTMIPTAFATEDNIPIDTSNVQESEPPALLEAPRAADDPCICIFQCEINTGGVSNPVCVRCNSGYSPFCEGCSCKELKGLCTAVGEDLMSSMT